MKRSLLFWLGTAAAVAIVVASLVLRGGGPADPVADVARQRADVTRFHELVRAGRWDDVYRRTTEPPAKTAAAFARLMRKQVESTARCPASASTRCVCCGHAPSRCSRCARR